MIAPADPIEAFCAYYHEYNAISEQRRRMQVRVLRELEERLPGAVLDIDAGQLREHVTWLSVVEGLHPNTVRQYINAIRPFLTWLWESKLISADTLLEMRAIKPPRGASGMGTPRPYSAKELRQFWFDFEAKYPWARDQNTKQRAEWYVKRWLNGTSRWNRVQPYARRLQMEAMIALALYGGLRRDEIFKIRLDELHPDNSYIVVRSRKTRDGRERIRGVPWMSAAMSDAVRAWLDFRDLIDPVHDQPWLCLYQNVHHLKPLQHRSFEMLLRQVGNGYEFHRMRHTAATQMLRSGIPLEKASKILGHSRLEQTLQYAKIAHEDVVRAARYAEGTYAHAFERPQSDKEAA